PILILTTPPPHSSSLTPDKSLIRSYRLCSAANPPLPLLRSFAPVSCHHLDGGADEPRRRSYCRLVDVLFFRWLRLERPLVLLFCPCGIGGWSKGLAGHGA
ncbi:hypothetical protein BHE74_00049127, partial [Ensete ventricosum]